jgi:hypothetical protein
MKVSTKSLGLAVLLVLATWAVKSWSAAGTEDATQAVPKIVQTGLDAYKANGADAAIKAWLKGSALEGEKQATSQAASFKQIENYYASYKSWEIVQVKDISKSTKIVYLVMNFQRGPVFASFVCYKADPDWVLPTFNFNTKPEAVFPPLMLSEAK